MPERPDLRDTAQRWTNRIAATHSADAEDALAFARDLRQQMTREGEALWRALRGNRMGFKFRRQHPLGPYMADFYCHAARLVVELDGDSHDERKEMDAVRDVWMRSQGCEVIRFTNREFAADGQAVVDRIQLVVASRVRVLSAASETLKEEKSE